MADNGQGQQKPGKHNRKLRNLLLDWRYQLRYTATMVTISLGLTGLLGYFVMSKAREASRVVEVRAMDPTDDMAQELVKQFARNDALMIWSLIGFGVLLAAVLSIYGIVMTHKVAGPLFKVSMYLDRIRDGKLGTIYNLRKGDELVEFFEHFKAAHEALRKQAEEDVRLLDETMSVVADEKVKEAMRALRDKKVESLK